MTFQALPIKKLDPSAMSSKKIWISIFNRLGGVRCNLVEPHLRKTRHTLIRSRFKNVLRALFKQAF